MRLPFGPKHVLGVAAFAGLALGCAAETPSVTPRISIASPLDDGTVTIDAQQRSPVVFAFENFTLKAPGAEVIVYVVGFTEPPAANAQVIVKQKGRKFVPELVAVTLGGKVNFPNEDAFLHNVFSQSSSRKFDLGSF